jgi:LacI family transcriptional regulator
MNREGAALGCEVVMVTRCTGQMPLIVSRRQVDGVLWMPADLDVARGAPAVPVPCVTLLYEIPGADLVTVDNFAGARAVGRRLCALGHRRIAFIGPTTDLARERLAGLRAAAAEAGATVPQDLVFLEKFVASDEPTADLLRRVLPAGSRPPFTALVAYNDFMADLALHHARAQGLRVPGDLSIAGFDGVLPSRLREPVTITSAAVPLEELGAAAVRMLAWRLSGPDAPRRKVTLETTLIEGATAGPP